MPVEITPRGSAHKPVGFNVPPTSPTWDHVPAEYSSKRLSSKRKARSGPTAKAGPGTVRDLWKVNLSFSMKAVPLPYPANQAVNSSGPLEKLGHSLGEVI